MKNSFIKLNAQGFSLIEVLVAVALVGVAIVANLTISGQIAKNLGYDTNIAIATQLSSNVMEDLMIRNSSDPLLAAGTHSQDFDLNQIQVVNGSFTVSWVVSLDTPMMSVMQIVETVSIHSQAAARSVVLTSFRGEQ